MFRNLFILAISVSLNTVEYPLRSMKEIYGKYTKIIYLRRQRYGLVKYRIISMNTSLHWGQISIIVICEEKNHAWR